MFLWLAFFQNSITFKKERTNVVIYYYNFYLEKELLMRNVIRNVISQKNCYLFQSQYEFQSQYPVNMRHDNDFSVHIENKKYYLDENY